MCVCLEHAHSEFICVCGDDRHWVWRAWSCKLHSTLETLSNSYPKWLFAWYQTHCAASLCTHFRPYDQISGVALWRLRGDGWDSVIFARWQTLATRLKCRLYTNYMDEWFSREFALSNVNSVTIRRPGVFQLLGRLCRHRVKAANFRGLKLSVCMTSAEGFMQISSTLFHSHSPNLSRFRWAFLCVHLFYFFSPFVSLQSYAIKKPLEVYYPFFVYVYVITEPVSPV